MNKYVFWILLLLLVSFVSIRVYSILNVNKELELLGKIIYVDAGHGGTDPGAIYGNVIESKINLKIAVKLRDELISRGAIVYMTREYDNDLSYPNSYFRKKSDLINRARIIDRSGADMYISIHLNASGDTSWKGAQVFYDDINPNNKILANEIQLQLKKDLKTKRKFKEIKDLYMYKNTKTLGVLAEVGFLSNSYERNLLITDNYQQKIANSISNAIVNYYKEL